MKSRIGLGPAAVSTGQRSVASGSRGRLVSGSRAHVIHGRPATRSTPRARPSVLCACCGRRAEWDLAVRTLVPPCRTVDTRRGVEQKFGRTSNIWCPTPRTTRPSMASVVEGSYAAQGKREGLLRLHQRPSRESTHEGCEQLRPTPACSGQKPHYEGAARERDTAVCGRALGEPVVWRLQRGRRRTVWMCARTDRAMGVSHAKPRTAGGTEDGKRGARGGDAVNEDYGERRRAHAFHRTRKHGRPISRRGQAQHRVELVIRPGA